MAKTFNPQRVGGGTFSLVRDSQGNYSLKETGFDKVVSLPMIELGQTAQTTTAQQTKTASQLTGQTAQALTSGATTGGGGGGGAFQFTDANPYKLQEQGEDVSKRLTQSQVDSNRDFMMGMGGKTDTGAPFPGRSRGMGGPALGISASPQTTQVADQDLEADVGTQAQLGIKKAPTAVDQLKATGTQIKKTVDSILQPGAAIKLAGQVVGGVLKAISPEPSVMDKFKTGYFKTAGDLGSSTDPGRIVGNPQTNVFAGMNRNSAFGNLGQSGQKRVDRVSGYASKNREKAAKARKAGNLEKARKYDEKAKRQEDKARTFQEQVDKYNKDKPVTGTTKPGESGGADNSRDSGKIVCTMMNESYGFGSFRNKIWMKFHRNISPEYQKGYHKLFLPLVKYAKQKGITNKFIKNILEHIAVHSTIDMRQSLRGKRHTLGRVYRKIILPLCYWVGKK